MMCDLIRERKLEELAEDVPELKCLQKIIDSKESVYISWDLATLYPERINIARSPLVVTAGKVVPYDKRIHDERLKHWYGGSA